MRGMKKYRHVIETPDPGRWELVGYEAALPISEKSNPITRELDRADPMQIVQLLKECDAEIFQEEEEALLNYKRLYSQSVLKTMIDIINKVQEVLKDPENGLIVLSGSGTSGRLAFLIATAFNKLLRGLGQLPRYTHIIAGGHRMGFCARASRISRKRPPEWKFHMERSREHPPAGHSQDWTHWDRMTPSHWLTERDQHYFQTLNELRKTDYGAVEPDLESHLKSRSLVMSQEGLEDSALLGTEELRKVCDGKKKVVFIGISCGLSAPFVAGQLDFCMNNLDIFLPVLLGFNPVSMARNDKIEGWHSTFRQVAERMQKLQESHKAFILNPAVGPEGICGFSWMKGGSATKILLETVLLAAHKTVSRESEISEKCLVEILRTYERAHEVTYAQSRKIAALVKEAGTSLQKKACVYVLGWHTLGLIAIMDGVECIPTFGADHKDVQGFLIGDHNDIFNKEVELTAQGPQVAFSQEDFVRIILPSLTELDTVLFLFTLDDDLAEVEELVIQVKEKTSNIQALSHATVGQYLPASLKKLFPDIISIMWPILFLEYEGNFIQKFQRELSTKWILNTVSTGAYVLKGKILRNCMVDLRIGNSKLFWRAVSILQRFTGHSQARCLDSLLQVIYDSEVVLDDLRNKDISTHILVATEKNKVVPTALLCLLRNCSVQEARMRLDTSHSIRAAIEASLNAPGHKRGADKSDAASRIT